MNTLIAVKPTVGYKPRIGAQLIAYYSQPEFEQVFFPVEFPVGTRFSSTGVYLAVMNGTALRAMLRAAYHIRRDGSLGPMVYVPVWLPDGVTLRYEVVERISTEMVEEILMEGH